MVDDKEKIRHFKSVVIFQMCTNSIIKWFCFLRGMVRSGGRKELMMEPKELISTDNSKMNCTHTYKYKYIHIHSTCVYICVRNLFQRQKPWNWSPMKPFNTFRHRITHCTTESKDWFLICIWYRINLTKTDLYIAKIEVWLKLDWYSMWGELCLRNDKSKYWILIDGGVRWHVY